MSNLFDKKTEVLFKEIEKNKEYNKLKYKKDDPLDFIISKKLEQNISNKYLAQKLNISESHMSKILKGERSTRDITIQIGIILKLSLVEVNQVLKYLSFAKLYVKDERDSIIIHGIIHNIDIENINASLAKHNHIKLG